jgi:filamentous hemagglutinin
MVGVNIKNAYNGTYSRPSPTAGVVFNEKLPEETQPASGLVFDDKIKGQLKERGWTEQEIEGLVGSGAPTGTSVDQRGSGKTEDRLGRNDTASVWGDSGGYVVVNDRTGEVVQVSDKNDPNWSPDDRIQWK